MKTWYLLAAAVAYYLYTQSTAGKLAAIQAEASPANHPIPTIDVMTSLTDTIPLTPIDPYPLQSFSITGVGQ